MRKCSKLGLMRGTCIVVGIATIFLAFAGGQQVTAQNNRSAPSGPPAAPTMPTPQVDDAAVRLLKQMGEYIGSAQEFTFHADITFDHVLPSGQKLQFSAVEQVALQRPAGLYVQWDGDLGSRQLWYDSKAVTIYDPTTNFYGAEATPPTIDGMLEKLIHQLDFAPPLADLLYSDPYKSLRGTIQYGFVVGETQINGRICRGLAFVEEHIDWQIWIDTGPQPVPCKLVITYKNDQAFPQFTALFSDWDFAPRIAAATFSPDLPSGAQAISFATVHANLDSK